jgi:O-antigen ligase
MNPPLASAPVRPISERLAVAIVAATTIAAPLALGCSSAETRFGLETTLVIAIALWIGNRRSLLTLPLMPFCIFAALMIQQIPLPENTLVSVAPVSAGAWKLALAGDPGGSGCISVNPASSLAGAFRVLLLASTLALVVDLGQYKSNRRILLIGLTISAFCVGALGAWFGSAQKTRLLLGMIDLSGPIEKSMNPLLLTEQSAGMGWPALQTLENMRFSEENRSIGDGFGSYRYSNHFAGGTLLTLPIAVSLWLWVTRRRLSAVVRWGVAGVMFGGALWVVGAMAQSRAGVGALGLAALTLVYLNISSRPGKIFIGVTTVGYVLSIGGLLAFMLGAWHWILPVLAPASQNVMSHFLSDGRSLAAQVALRMFRASPWLGTGLNTFEQIFPRFHSGHTRLYFAHNDYLQVLAETGLVGGMALAALAVLSIRRFRRFDKDAAGEYRQLNSGCWAALAGIVIHSAFDWNLYLPANAFLWCVVLGLCISSAPPGRRTRQVPPRWPHAGTLSRFLLLLTVLGAFAGLARDCLSERARRTLGQTVITVRVDKEAGQQLLQDQLARAIAATMKAADRDPANATLAVLLSQAHLRLASLTTDEAAQHQALRGSNDWARRARRLNPTCPGIPEETSKRP